MWEHPLPPPCPPSLMHTFALGYNTISHGGNVGYDCNSFSSKGIFYRLGASVAAIKVIITFRMQPKLQFVHDPNH